MKNLHLIPKEKLNQDLRKYPLTPDECYKQETLEEAAENYVKDESNRTYRFISKASFQDGAKWQQERMYSEEDLRNAYRWGTTVNHGTKEHFNEWFEQFKKKV